MTANLHDLLRARAADLDKCALETPDGGRISYGELYARAGRMARALVDLGVEPGDRVAAQIDKSPDAIVLALACFRAGAALLPLNTAYTLAELEYFLGDAEPALTLCRPGASRGGARACATSSGLRAVESLGERGDGTLRRARRRSARRNCRRSRARPTISPRSSTPPARPAARRARC